MTTLEEIQETTAQNAIGAALEAAEASYAEITRTRNDLNAMEAQGVYAEGYIEEQREKTAARVQQTVEGRLDSARTRLDDVRLTVTRKLDKLIKLDPDELAAARGHVAMFLGDLREEPEQLLTAYEQSFDVPADRRAIEELAERALRMLPDTPQRGMFEANWNQLKERLENRLPFEQRQPRAALGELDRAEEYLASVEQVVTAAIRSLVNPRQAGNLTAYSQVFAYEKELTGEPAIEAAVPTATAVG